MHHFCTYFDHNYIPQGMILYNSLKKTCDSFRLYVLCLSPECYTILHEEAHSDIELIQLSELEQAFPDLKAAEKNRGKVEYYFTLTPCLPYYILKQHPDVPMITYLDSDLFFLNSPEPIFDEIGDNSVAIISHRFSDANKHKEKAGKFNVGWISYRNDPNGIACLEWYMEKCIEWCYDILEEDRYADQKYLESFSERFDGVIAIENKGANLAPWNVDNYTMSEQGETFLVDNDEIVFFHVQGLRKVWGSFYDTGFFQYNATLSPCLKNHVYRPYLKQLVHYKSTYEKRLPQANSNGIREDKSVSRFDFIKRISPWLFDWLAFVKRVYVIYRAGSYVRVPPP